MTIYLFELRQNIVSIAIWALSIAGFILFYMMFFPMFADDASLIDMMIENFPPEFLAAFGMNSELPMNTVIGYFSLTYSFTYIIIAIHASMQGFGILSKEERELTADFLFTKPISRSTIFFSKFLSTCTNLLIINIFTWFGQDYSFEHVYVLLLSLPLFQLFFVGIGMLVSVLVRKIKSVLPYAMGVSFGLYTMQSLASMLDSDFMSYFSPYSYFEPSKILVSGGYDIPQFILAIIIITSTITASYFLYLRRNIASL